MIRQLAIATTLACALWSAGASAERSAAAPGAKVYFVNLKNGDTVSSPFKVVFGLDGMKVAPAGTQTAHTGHHHLLIDRAPIGRGAKGGQELGMSLPADKQHLHFGKGQTETMLTLAPGKHTLQLVLGDGMHVPHDKPVASDVITVTVK
ncbi:MAG: DUF4399 domain-containing protein [Burkholderiaceae bacterium]